MADKLHPDFHDPLVQNAPSLKSTSDSCLRSQFRHAKKHLLGLPGSFPTLAAPTVESLLVNLRSLVLQEAWALALMHIDSAVGSHLYVHAGNVVR